MEEHAEGREADGAARVDGEDEQADEGADHELGPVRHAVAGVHRGEPAGEIAGAAHRQRGPADAGDQGQQRTERRVRRTDPGHFDPKLARVWSARARVTLQSWTTDPQTGAMTSSTETVPVGTNFIGKGKTTWTSETSNQCPIDGSPNCQTFELDGNRNAAASIRFGSKTLSGPGHLNSVFLVSKQLAG